jgi:hypothetical protein
MNYPIFANELKNFPAFGAKEIKKLSGKVYFHRLDEWKRKDISGG